MSSPVGSVGQGEAVETDGLVEFSPFMTSENEHDGSCGRDCDAGWVCTRVRGHEGNHEACGGGDRIYASWPADRPVVVGEGEAVETSQCTQSDDAYDALRQRLREDGPLIVEVLSGELRPDGFSAAAAQPGGEQ